MSVIFRLSYPILGGLSGEAAGAAGARKFCRLVEGRHLTVSDSVMKGQHELSTGVVDNELALELLVELLDAGLSPDVLVAGATKDDAMGQAMYWAFATRRLQLSQIQFTGPELAIGF